MLRDEGKTKRTLKEVGIQSDLVVVGGGMAGVCGAITAARAGCTVTLVQDRPVLGGNASSEVRLWILGATSHGGNNNRWAREGGVIDEILVENMYRNPEGNPLVLDTILLEKVVEESRITLLLNTVAFEIQKSDPDTISGVRAFCSQNSTMFTIQAPLFCDASGDGVVGFLAGAAFRLGAESADEFGEALAPSESYGELLGDSNYFYSKEMGNPVEFTAPSFALKDISKIPRYRSFKAGEHDDAVSYGGWALDLHPADGVYSDRSGCDQWHSKGVYQIPYRCMYSRNIRNLFLAGRNISASHVAFGSSRVMATCAHNARAVGMAAAVCREKELFPSDLLTSDQMGELQSRLVRTGQFSPKSIIKDRDDLSRQARITATSALELAELVPDGETVPLDRGRAMAVPVVAGDVPQIAVWTEADEPVDVTVELRTSSRYGSYTPDTVVATQTLRVGALQPQPADVKKTSVSVAAGGSTHTALVAGLCESDAIGNPAAKTKAVPTWIDFNVKLDKSQYVFVCFAPAKGVRLQTSKQRVTGIASLVHQCNDQVAEGSTQRPGPNIGVDAFEFWIPERRPAGRNLAARFDPPLAVYSPSNVTNGPSRPTYLPNAWVADRKDTTPALRLEWEAPMKISRIEVDLDTDFDHPMESVLLGHPERFVPFCVRVFRVTDDQGSEIRRFADNHQTRCTIHLDEPAITRSIRIEVMHPSKEVPAAIMAVRCF